MLSCLHRHAALIACAAACTWAVLVVAAPALAASTRLGRGAVVTAAVTYLAGSSLCHQQPGRSFHVAGAQLPVCARCTGLYLAGAAGTLVALVLGVRVKAASWRPVLLVAALPMALSVLLEWIGAWSGSNVGRAVTGIPPGAAVGALLIQSLSFRGKL